MIGNGHEEDLISLLETLKGTIEPRRIKVLTTSILTRNNVIKLNNYEKVFIEGMIRLLNGAFEKLNSLH